MKAILDVQQHAFFCQSDLSLHSLMRKGLAFYKIFYTQHGKEFTASVLSQN